MIARMYRSQDDNVSIICNNNVMSVRHFRAVPTIPIQFALHACFIAFFARSYDLRTIAFSFRRASCEWKRDNSIFRCANASQGPFNLRLTGRGVNLGQLYTAVVINTY